MAHIAVRHTAKVPANEFQGRGTLECVNTQKMAVEYKNRWTASNATILSVAPRNCGVFAAGGAGKLSLFNGIHDCVRDIELDKVIIRIEVDSCSQKIYRNTVEQVYLGCGADGIACVEFGIPAETEVQLEDGREQRIDSLLTGEYSDMYYFRSNFV